MKREPFKDLPVSGSAASRARLSRKASPGVWGRGPCNPHAGLLFITWLPPFGRKVSKITHVNCHNLCVRLYGDAGAGLLTPRRGLPRRVVAGCSRPAVSPFVCSPVGCEEGRLPWQEGAPLGHALGAHGKQVLKRFREFRQCCGTRRRSRPCEDSVAHTCRLK